MQTLSGWIGRWNPGIGDPTVMGWITVVAYFACAWLCWRARGVAIKETQAGARHQSAGLWTAFSIGLIALGFNKQLDLQSAFTELGRILARAQGWYEDRRGVQIAFIVAVLLVAAAACAWLVIRSRRDLRRVLPALIGAAVLCAFVAIRASSFHRMDLFIGFELTGVRLNWIMELGGIALIAVGALRYSRSARADSASARTQTRRSAVAELWYKRSGR